LYLASGQFDFAAVRAFAGEVFADVNPAALGNTQYGSIVVDYFGGAAGFGPQQVTAGDLVTVFGGFCRQLAVGENVHLTCHPAQCSDDSSMQVSYADAEGKHADACKYSADRSYPFHAVHGVLSLKAKFYAAHDDVPLVVIEVNVRHGTGVVILQIEIEVGNQLLVK